MKVRYFYIFCCLVALATGIRAQGTISGRVVDGKSGQAVEYATVAVLKFNDSSLETGSVTASNGTFSVKAAYGKYIVRVSFMGYTTYFYPEAVVLSTKHPTQNLGKLQITPSAVMMNEVMVNAERTMVEYQLDKRVVNVDKNLVSSGGTATDVLEQVPSVAVDNDGNVTLRGSSNVKVLINGRPYELMGNDLETLLEQIPATTVESVEVITNPSAKYDPEGMSGIINLKLKDKTSAALGLNGVVNLNVGAPLPFLIPEQMPQFIPTSMASINLTYSTEKYNLFFSVDGGMRSRGSFGHSNIERLKADGPWSHDTNDQYSLRRNYMGSMKIGGEYYFNDKNSLLLSYQLRGGLRNRTSQIFSTDLLSDHFLDYEQLDTNHNRNINHVFNASYIKKFDEKDRELTMDATFTMRHVQGDGIQEQLYPNMFANWQNYYLRETMSENFHKALNLKLNYVHPFAEKWKFETGYEGRLDWPDQNADYYRTEFQTSATSFGIKYFLNRYYDSVSSTHFNYNQQTHAVYATVGGKITDKLSAQGGLRVEYAYLLGYDVNHPAADESGQERRQRPRHRKERTEERISCENRIEPCLRRRNEKCRRRALSGTRFSESRRQRQHAA